MNEEQRLEEALRANMGELFEDTTSKPHLDDLALEAKVQKGAAFDEREQQHLAECTECRAVVSALIQSREEQGAVVPLRRFRQVVAPLLALAAAIALIVIIPRLKPEHTATLKGERAPLAAEVTLLASSEGRRRDVRDGDPIRIDELLGFKYGNPQGDASDVTIIGWDGQSVHWYYPEAPSGSPHQLKKGPKVMSIRLPFDINLKEKHKPGPLTIAVAFDARPEEIAAQLKRGALKETRGVKLFRLKISPSGDPGTEAHPERK